jgi:hypothetical protein
LSDLPGSPFPEVGMLPITLAVHPSGRFLYVGQTTPATSRPTPSTPMGSSRSRDRRFHFRPGASSEAVCWRRTPRGDSSSRLPGGSSLQSWSTPSIRSRARWSR